jgi:outer membrane protein TolC
MSSSRSVVLAGAVAAALLTAPRAQALQPLEAFLRGARTASPDNQEARASTDFSRAESSVATGRLLPGVTLRGTYARNQYDLSETVGGQVVTLTPKNQLDGYAILTVPLVDSASFVRARAARGNERAAQEQEKDAALQVEGAVAQAYYQVIADLGLVEESKRALEVARANLTLTEHQRAAGSVAGLDVDRARAEVERQVQQLASAELGLRLDARALTSRSGLAPELGAAAPLQDDLHEEPALETFVPADAALPAVAAAMESRRAQEQQALAQRLTLVPTLTGSLTEHGTNAPGFIPHDFSYQALLALSWSFDFTTLPAIRAEDARLAVTAAREERARLAVHDAIHRAWSTVQTDIARSRSARAQAEVSDRAANLARDRYRIGTGTQLDLLQAQRDAFAAEVNRIQADADLVNVRAQLRLAAGRSLLEN